MMALEDVNSRLDLLPGYKLKLHWNDSEVSAEMQKHYLFSTVILFY